MSRARIKPKDSLHFKTDPAVYTVIVQHQREFARAAADALESGEPFDELRLEVVAVLRARAVQPWRGARPKGAPADRGPERAAIIAAADAIERREPFDASTVAKALRAWAGTLKATPPEPNKNHTIDHAQVALRWHAQKRARDVSDYQLRKELSADYGVDASTIKDAVVGYGGAADSFIARLIALGAKWKRGNK